MVFDGQRPFDLFDEELGSAESKFLLYGNGKDKKPPTGFMFEKEQMKGLYFPFEGWSLGYGVNETHPSRPYIMEKLSLSADKYGTGRRFFIQTLDGCALSPDVQEKLVRENIPEGVFNIKGSHHLPFFLKPRSLHKLLLEIANQ